MNFTLGELAALVNGQLHGDAEILIDGADINRDVQHGQITLAAGPHLSDDLASCPAAAVVVLGGFIPDGIPFIIVDDLHGSFTKIVKLFRHAEKSQAVGISPSAFVSESARIAEGAVVFPGATVGDQVSVGAGSVIHSGARISAGCDIGEDVTIFPNAVLYEDTVVGNRAIIHAGAIIGCYGFGYHTSGGRHQLTAQLGSVLIGEDVEIGAGTTIDRGTYGRTTIGDGTKVDNQVQIAHNCRIGKHNLICSQVGIAGTATIGDYVAMAGQCGISDHIKVGDQVVLAAKSGVIKNVADRQVYMGIPATPEREQKIKQAALAKLPQMRKELKALVKRIEFLERHAQREAA